MTLLATRPPDAARLGAVERRAGAADGGTAATGAVVRLPAIVIEEGRGISSMTMAVAVHRPLRV
ncbi:hypothetical protein [Streptomyces sp. NPDC005476]|uniref:hypothetical protein n=1 Tax=Streptomyces sp. NPDC005476 TaxID=3156882 RepID=UPI0034544784